MDEHIDTHQLNNNLRYRFDYLCKFLHFTPYDIVMLNQFAQILLPSIPVVADTVYRKLLAFDITKHYFLIRNDGFEGPLIKKDTNLTVNSAQMTFRKDMLSMYLKRVLTQHEWTDSFLQYLSQVGKMHTNQAGSSSINVDYIHINTLFGYLEHILLNILWTSENLNETNKHDMVMAVNKLFWIQNDFFTMHYTRSWNDEDSTSNQSPMDKNKYCCF